MDFTSILMLTLKLIAAYIGVSLFIGLISFLATVAVIFYIVRKLLRN